MIKREIYLRKIRPFYNQDLIKVITGIRRCGKSVLLNQIIEELKDNKIDENHIIYINFENYDYIKYTDPKKFNRYITNLIKDEKKYYLLFDEIQNVIDWEKVINSFRATKNVSIFITGSNSNLLSGELATHLAGRYVSFGIQPFSFTEACTMNNVEESNIDDFFIDYIKWGGFPQRYTVGEEQQIISYLEDVYNSIILKDIVVRNNIQNVEMLETLIQYLISTPTQIFSGINITNYFKSLNRKVGMETIYNYLNYIENSFVIKRVPRYDVYGKKLLARQDKYYVCDLGLTRIRNIDKKIDIGASLENIVYNELVNRGYTVYTGKNNNKEIDFIATKVGEKKYFQVTYMLVDDKTIEREFGAYKGIEDNYPKYVLSMDKLNFSRDGIIHSNLIDWLLEEDKEIGR